MTKNCEFHVTNIIGLYKITTRSINFGLDVKQFGVSSEDHVITPFVWQSVLFSMHPC